MTLRSSFVLVSLVLALSALAFAACRSGGQATFQVSCLELQDLRPGETAGGRMTIPEGTNLDVVVCAGGGAVWAAPQVSDESVLRYEGERLAGAPTASDATSIAGAPGVEIWHFVAEKQGMARISSQAGQTSGAGAPWQFLLEITVN